MSEDGFKCLMCTCVVVDLNEANDCVLECSFIFIVVIICVIKFAWFSCWLFISQANHIYGLRILFYLCG